MSVDAVTAAYLKSEAMFVTRSPGAAIDWAGSDRVGEIVSPLAAQADAQAEADRQLAFLAAPRSIERIEVPGNRADLLGRAVTIAAKGGGYDAGVAVFVIGVEELAEVDRTILTVLRRLA
ncbi:hypothetical protein GO308_09655 [Sphingomonas sp. SFZ2018-12]|uniref:hypothetical protein n=1 Tax=Sphingomonas sp. SFZ2018-12 TaxID=2683197 RepID=UPI001F0DEA81|nr:hypothetical protein [Sphingomonas sp. SFZ2018-12]MCH4893373.1 hypothetical protein [Sphingomonas sp. SFZ2018-12]